MRTTERVYISSTSTTDIMLRLPVAMNDADVYEFEELMKIVFKQIHRRLEIKAEALEPVAPTPEGK